MRATAETGRPGTIDPRLRACAIVGMPVLAALVLASHTKSALLWAAALALAPLIVVAVSRLSIEMLAIALVVGTQVSGLRLFFVGFHFLPEHFALALVLGGLVVHEPQVLWRRPAAFEICLLAWVGWSAVVSVAVPGETSSRLAVVGWMGLAWLIMWTLRGAFGLDPSVFRRTMAAGAAVASAIGIFAFVLWVGALFGVIHVLVQGDAVTGAVGAQGFGYEGNIYGATQLFWLFWLLRDRVLHQAKVPAWQVAALTLGVVSSMTRAVWLGAVIVGAGALYVARRPAAGRITVGHGGRGGLRLLIVGALLTLVLLSATPAGQKFNEGLNFNTSTGAGRVTNWKLAWRDLNTPREYLAGLGTNSFGERHLSRTLHGQPDYLGNLPLTVFYDGGLVGLGLFLAGLGGMVFRSRDPSTRLMTGAFVVSLLVVGAATSPIWFGFVWVIVAAVDADSRPPPPLEPSLAPLVEGLQSPSAPAAGR